ncbi:MAG: hypothetical protein V3574_00610 [Candidatus Moraniibacteriota bacterium]
MKTQTKGLIWGIIIGILSLFHSLFFFMSCAGGCSSSMFIYINLSYFVSAFLEMIFNNDTITYSSLILSGPIIYGSIGWLIGKVRSRSSKNINTNFINYN